jgi:hypothetical protein
MGFVIVLHFALPMSWVIWFAYRQAGAELCQAQIKLSLAKLAVTKTKLKAYKFEIIFHLKKNPFA